MGQENIKLTTTPTGWAMKLSNVVKIVHEAHGLDRFPIKVADVARDYSHSVYPGSPITLVEGRAFGKFEGALIPRPNASGEWGISIIRALARRGASISPWPMSKVIIYFIVI